MTWPCSENDVYGDGVNVAARLESLCDPGGVMILRHRLRSPPGQDSTSPLEFVGEQQVKNITRPVRAYRARIEGVRAPRAGAGCPFAAASAAALAAPGRGGGLVGLVDLRRAARQCLDRGPAVRQSGRRRGDWPARRGHHRGSDHRADPLSRHRRDRPRRHPSLPRTVEIDVREVGNELQVRFVLDGTIQRQGERLRITAQLIETASARDVWSDRWEPCRHRLFAVQSEVAEAVASRLASPYSGPIVAVERASAKRKPAQQPVGLRSLPAGHGGAEPGQPRGLPGSDLARLQQSLATRSRVRPGLDRHWPRPIRGWRRWRAIPGAGPGPRGGRPQGGRHWIRPTPRRMPRWRPTTWTPAIRPAPRASSTGPSA